MCFASGNSESGDKKPVSQPPKPDLSIDSVKLQMTCDIALRNSIDSGVIFAARVIYDAINAMIRTMDKFEYLKI